MNIRLWLSQLSPRAQAKPGETEEFQEKLQSFRREIHAGRHAQRFDSFAKSTDALQQPDEVYAVNEEAEAENTPFKGDLLDLSAEEALRSFASKMAGVKDFSGKNGNDVRRTIEDLASQYAVYKRHITKYGTGEQIKKFESLFEKTVDRYAGSYAREVGGFYESKGLAGEKARMHDAVKNRVVTLADSYGQFISNFGEIMDDVVRESKEGVSGIAEGIRAAYKKEGDGELITPGANGRYTRDALSAAADLMIYAEKIMTKGKASAASEEELGVKLGELALDALAFLETSPALNGHKEIFLNIVGERIEEIMGESGKLLEKEAPLDKDAVQSVIQKMVDCFARTKSVTDSIVAGKEKGLRLYLEKQDAKGDVARYRSSSYWENEQRQIETLRRQRIQAMLGYSAMQDLNNK